MYCAFPKATNPYLLDCLGNAIMQWGWSLFAGNVYVCVVSKMFTRTPVCVCYNFKANKISNCWNDWPGLYLHQGINPAVDQVPTLAMPLYSRYHLGIRIYLASKNMDTYLYCLKHTKMTFFPYKLNLIVIVFGKLLMKFITASCKFTTLVCHPQAFLIRLAPQKFLLDPPMVSKILPNYNCLALEISTLQQRLYTSVWGCS